MEKINKNMEPLKRSFENLEVQRDKEKAKKDAEAK